MQPTPAPAPVPEPAAVAAAGQVPGEVRYRCDGLGQSLTIDELRDAGWRLEQMKIDVRVEVDGETGLPLSISVRKLH